jgi:alkyldihydroxyacetonephosphate synthase
MKRWNGWGDESTHYHLPESAAIFLAERLGAPSPQPEVAIGQIAIPESRLTAHPLIALDPIDRLRHARGHSLPDWIALRSGRIGPIPDGVAYPMSGDDVRELIDHAARQHIHLIPYGGGTSVVGHINPLDRDTPVLTVDMGRMNQMIALDSESRLATFGAGVTGPQIEAQLRANGLTLGHYPQSWEYSTLGGWIATRSSGQQSLYYGRIEALFAGGTVETPSGRLTLPLFPASAAGPDLRQMVLGSEGRMGIVTEATVQASPLPEREVFQAVFFPDFEQGMAAVRQMVHLPLSMLRLSTAIETETTLALAGRPRQIETLEGLLRARGVGEGKTMLMFGYTGSARLARPTIRAALAAAGHHGGVHLGIGRIFGTQWQKSRFRTPYLRNTLWDMGYAIDTVETATTWDNVPAMVAAMEAALRAEEDPIYVFTHLSHLYAQGASVYTTYAFRLSADPDETLARWRHLKHAISTAIIEQGGTISHQHGVGVDHMLYLGAEKGPLGMEALRTLWHQFDPERIMNPGKLVGHAG